MADLRYVGSATWTRVVTDKDGKFSRLENVEPNDIVEFSDKDAEHLCKPDAPRGYRVFVIAGSDEDPYQDEYNEENKPKTPAKASTPTPNPTDNK